MFKLQRQIRSSTSSGERVDFKFSNFQALQVYFLLILLLTLMIRSFIFLGSLHCIEIYDYRYQRDGTGFFCL